MAGRHRGKGFGEDDRGLRLLIGVGAALYLCAIIKVGLRDPPMDARQILHSIMADLGTDTLVPSVESSPTSVWVTEDRAPGGVPGYYEKVRRPPPYRIIPDGRAAIFDFTINGVDYRIRSGQADDLDANLAVIVTVWRQLQAWREAGIVSWPAALLPFRKESSATEWWQILRAPPDATSEEIDQAYRRQARACHPDVGGTAEQFLRLHDARLAGLRARDPRK